LQFSKAQTDKTAWLCPYSRSLVSTPKEEDDGERFMDKMERFTTQLKDQFEQSSKLEAEIKKNLAGLDYGL